MKKPEAITPQLPDPVPETSARLEDAVKESRREGEKITEFDLDADGRAEVRVFAIPLPGGRERVVRKEIDHDGDGRPELRKQFAESGLLELEAYDSNSDGILDSVAFFDAGTLQRTERDEDADGRRETWVFYAQDEIQRVEVDRDGDGKPDYREDWAEGRMVRNTDQAPETDAGSR